MTLNAELKHAVGMDPKEKGKGINPQALKQMKPAELEKAARQRVHQKDARYAKVWRAY
jgi:hypothetical protein